MLAKQQIHRPRSFVRRDSRKTAAQDKALIDLWPKYGLSGSELIDFASVFANQAPTYLEIGFGSGQSLLQAAERYPEFNFIGVETYKPGIGALLLGVEQRELTNLRVAYGDAYEVIANCLVDESLAGVQIFFPDPWPKRRHHPRRLIQTEFLDLLLPKLVRHASMHLATDWQDYALHMLKTLNQHPLLRNCYENFAPRSRFRPIITKFEQRALREERQIHDLEFLKL